MNETNRYGDGGTSDSDGGAWSESPGAFDNEGWGRNPWETPATGGHGYPQGQADPYAGIGAGGYPQQGGHPQQGYPGYSENAGYPEYSGAAYPASAAVGAGSGSGSGGGKGKIVGIVIAVLALAGAGIAVGYAGYELGWFGGGDDRATASERRADRDDGGTASDATTSEEAETSRRAEDFTVPASWNHCHGSGDPGDFNLAYAGTGVTSCPFAKAVRDSFADHYLDTGQTSGTIDAYSEVTGRSYTMSCTDDGDYVTCRGGNNAVVHIV